MKLLIGILFLLVPAFVSAQNTDLQNMSILASQYYQNKEFGKAAELYEQLYEATKAEGYLNIYLDCLLGIPDYEKAEKEIRKGLRGNSSDAYWYVQYGFLKKAQGQVQESLRMYDKAIGVLSDNPAEYPNLANQFINRREFEMAEKVYLKGRQKHDPTLFNYELARVYYYMRNYDLMLKEYLEWAKLKESNLEIAKSHLQSVLSMDNDQEISNQLKSYTLKLIQKEPGQILYNRMLIWLFIQDKNFSAAIRQLIALDKRNNQEDGNIYNLAVISGSNKEYDEAVKAFDYIIAKGSKSEFYSLALLQHMQMKYEQFIAEGILDIQRANELRAAFNHTLSVLGYSSETINLQINFAHLLCFYLDQPSEAIRILTEGTMLPGINIQQLSDMKAELSDIYVYSGDLWEAVISYSQVIESNKSNTTGDEVKLRKAKLGYYMGNFQWAKAQLDALRASTSKLIANDAMELALFIGDNLETDSTSAPLQIFARADYQLFRNKLPEAVATLDSITKLYGFNSLADDVNFRKAGILKKQGNYSEAATLYESIVNDHSWEPLADDALFELAGICQNKLGQNAKAMELYKKMMTDFPGSIFVVDARAEYRKLQSEGTTPIQPTQDSDLKLNDSAQTKEQHLFQAK